MGKRVSRLRRQHSVRSIEAVVKANERFPVGIIAGHRNIDTIKSVMISSFAILGLVIYHAPLHLNLARREIALEILHISRRVPQTPLHAGEEFEILSGRRGICQCNPMNLTTLSQRNKIQATDSQPVFLAGNPGITHTVTAFVEIQRGLARFPARTPHRTAVIDIEISSAGIHRDAVVAVAGDSTELRVPAEAIAACRSGNQ